MTMIDLREDPENSPVTPPEERATKKKNGA
jgi:hypothetical protein